MTFARWILTLSALAWAGFGVVLLVAPEQLSGVGLPVGNADARIEIRGFYGGLELGIAAFLGWCLAAPERLRHGLMCAALTVGGLAAGRVVGFVIEGGEGSGTSWFFAILETTATAVTVVALRRLGPTH